METLNVAASTSEKVQPLLLARENLLHFIQYIYCELHLEYEYSTEKYYARKVWYSNLLNKYLDQLPSAPRQQ